MGCPRRGVKSRQAVEAGRRGGRPGGRLLPLFRPRPAQSGTCQPQGYPDQGSLPLSDCLHNPHAPLPPLLDSTGGPFPGRYRVVESCFLSLLPLYIHLSLPIFCSVSWCRLEFNYSLGVLLRENFRPGHLHSMVINRLSPFPRCWGLWKNRKEKWCCGVLKYQST